MAQWTFYCWSCKQPTQMVDKVFRTDRCPHCQADMHCCLNCKHYDPGLPARCCDEFIQAPDPTKANFSTRFTPRTTPPSPAEDPEEARGKLSKLFP